MLVYLRRFVVYLNWSFASLIWWLLVCFIPSWIFLMLYILSFLSYRLIYINVFFRYEHRYNCKSPIDKTHYSEWKPPGAAIRIDYETCQSITNNYSNWCGHNNHTHEERFLRFVSVSINIQRNVNRQIYLTIPGQKPCKTHCIIVGKCSKGPQCKAIQQQTYYDYQFIAYLVKDKRCGYWSNDEAHEY